MIYSASTKWLLSSSQFLKRHKTRKEFSSTDLITLLSGGKLKKKRYIVFSLHFEDKNDYCKILCLNDLTHRIARQSQITGNVLFIPFK